MFWMRNNENNFPIHTLIWKPASLENHVDTQEWLEIRSSYTINVLNLNISFFCTPIKYVFFMARIYKMLVRIANGEYPDWTASSEAA